MTVQHSKNHTFIVGQESTYGTPVTADKDLGLIQNVSTLDKREVNKSWANGDREVQDITYGKVDLALDIELEVQHGRPFEYTFGGVAHVETTGDWKHTFSFADTLPSFTAEDSFNSTADSVFIRDGLKVGETVVSIDKAQKLKLKQTCIGKSVDTSTAAASAAVISSLKPLHYKNFNLLTGAAGSETKPGKVQKWDLTINNDIEGQEDNGEFEICEITEKNIEITFTFDMLFETTTEYDRFLGGTAPAEDPAEFSAVFSADNGVTLGSGRLEFYTQLAGVTYEENGKPVSVGDVVIQSFKGNATGLGSNAAYFVDSITNTAFS